MLRNYRVSWPERRNSKGYLDYLYPNLKSLFFRLRWNGYRRVGHVNINTKYWTRSGLLNDENLELLVVNKTTMFNISSDEIFLCSKRFVVCSIDNIQFHVGFVKSHIVWLFKTLYLEVSSWQEILQNRLSVKFSLWLNKCIQRLYYF